MAGRSLSTTASGKVAGPSAGKIWTTRAAKWLLSRALAEKESLQLQYLMHFRRQINWSQPTYFTEKMQCYKLYYRRPIMIELADKIEAKRHVETKLGREWIIPNLWTGGQLPPAVARQWRAPYVIKASHGCGWNIFVRTSDEENWSAIEQIIARWLKSKYGTESGQWAYATIKPRLLVEPFLSESGELLMDYKFFVFSGVVHFIQVDIGRHEDHRRLFFDRHWNRQPFTTAFPMYTGDISPPSSIEYMIEAAEMLGGEFPFVRVDLYQFNDRPKFGEMTFYPGSGFSKFDPPEYDAVLGQLWRVYE